LRLRQFWATFCPPLVKSHKTPLPTANGLILSALQKEEDAIMPKKNDSLSLSRRKFLAATSGLPAVAGLLASTPMAEASVARGVAANPAPTPPPASMRKIPIGVFDPVYNNLSLDEMLDRMTALGLEAVEVGTGGYPGASHCPVEELLASNAKAQAWKKKFTDRNIHVATLSCHGNPVYPDTKIAHDYDETFRRTVLLAERLEVPVIVCFSGCPGGSPEDTVPSWITYRWPPEHDKALYWQWNEKLIPYWKETVKFAREHGMKRIALEMHPNFMVYNPKTLMKLRDAAGEEIGANCDLSHLFWQGCDPVEVIHFLGKNNCLFHAHMKDTVIVPEEKAKFGVLNFPEDPAKATEGSVYFRAVGYGHGAQLWKRVVKAYMDVGFEGIMSIENEDPILTGEVGVERSAYVLKNVRAELLEGK
jgi:sugar phosphate isomerase/epimerase